MGFSTTLARSVRNVSRKLDVFYKVAAAVSPISFAVSAQAQLVSPQVFSSAPSCSACTIAVAERFSFRPPDSLSFDPTARAVRLPTGQFLFIGERQAMVETPLPALFDAGGRFLRLVSRVGEGPGELTGAREVIVAPGDSIWILSGRPAKNVFSSDLVFVRRDPFSSTTSAAVTGDGNSILAIANGGAAIAGYPLHLADRTGTIRKSFGIDDPTIDPRALAADGDNPTSFLRRWLTPVMGGSFWTYMPDRFLLERYDLSGKLLYKGQHALDGWYREASERMPGRGAFKGAALMQIQSSADPNMIWLMYHAPSSNFTSAPIQGGFTMMKFAEGRDVVIEAFDTRTYRVIAMHRFPKTVAMRVQLAPDTFAFLQPIDDIRHSYRVVSLRVTRSIP